MAIKISGITVIDDSRNVSVGILTATKINVPPVPITFSPGISSTGVAVDSNIIITFNRPVSKGTGNITLRSGSAGGTVLQTIGVSSIAVTISGGAVTIDPPANITGLGLTTFVVVDAGAFSVSGLTSTSVNDIINTYSFTTKTTIDVGDAYEGGYLICKASPLRWVVSPYSAEVTRTWDSRNDANTRAQAVSGCTGWFVPTMSQLQNPGYLCRSFWGTSSPCYTNTIFFSSTEYNATFACAVDFRNAGACNAFKPASLSVRAFRCVTY